MFVVSLVRVSVGLEHCTESAEVLSTEVGQVFVQALKMFMSGSISNHAQTHMD
jgi:hypothetical protein